MNFYKDGGNGTLEIPAISGYVPCTMLQLATVRVVEHSLPYELNTQVIRTQRSIEDMHPEVLTSTIQDEVFTKFNAMEGRSFMVGREYNEPPGIFSTPAVESVSASLTGDAVISLTYALSVRNRSSAAFLCNPDTLRDIKRLEDGNGRFLYRDGIAAGEPGRLLDWPLYPALDAPQGQLMFGNFRDGYTVELRPFVSILRDPFSMKPNVLFYATRKVGAQVENGDCFRKLEWQ